MTSEDQVLVVIMGVVLAASFVAGVWLLVDGWRRYCDAEIEKAEMQGRMQAVREWQETHGDDQKEEEK